MSIAVTLFLLLGFAQSSPAQSICPVGTYKVATSNPRIPVRCKRGKPPKKKAEPPPETPASFPEFTPQRTCKEFNVIFTRFYDSEVRAFTKLSTHHIELENAVKEQIKYEKRVVRKLDQKRRGARQRSILHSLYQRIRALTQDIKNRETILTEMKKDHSALEAGRKEIFRKNAQHLLSTRPPNCTVDVAAYGD